MGWNCFKCDGKIFSPRKGSNTYVMQWLYSKKKRDLSCELKNLLDVKESAFISHIDCPNPERKNWLVMIRRKLGIPKNVYHPLLE